jgi:hypothetical protein
VPFFSPRYIGHMSSDLTMASMVGYFATMLYNPNNVAAEASPVTTRMELEVAEQLARMIGYDPARQWGHLTSGGTVANFEALWVARNVKYLPVAIRWAADELGTDALPVTLPDGRVEEVRQLGLWELLNVQTGAALDLAEHFRARVGDGMEAATAVTRHSLAGLGYQEFGRRLAAQFGDAFPPGVVLVPSTAHYSWEKICRALGIGGAQLVHVPVDARFRMDPDALRHGLRTLAGRNQPVIGCISVIGTTEESAVDRLDLIADVRDEAARELGRCTCTPTRRGAATRPPSPAPPTGAGGATRTRSRTTRPSRGRRRACTAPCARWSAPTRSPSTRTSWGSSPTRRAR